MFGDGAQLIRDDIIITDDKSATVLYSSTNSAMDVSTSMPEKRTAQEPMQLQLHNQLMAKVIFSGINDLKEIVKKWHVNLSIDTDRALLTVVSTERTISGWQEACKDRISKHIETEFDELSVDIAPEANVQVTRVLSTLKMQEVSLFTEYMEISGALRAAGKRDVLANLKKKLKEIEEKYVTVNESMILTCENWIFITGVKLSEICKVHPNVTVTCDHAHYCLVLKGSRCDVDTLKNKIPRYSDHERVEVHLEPQVVQYLLRNGKARLHQFLEGKEKHFCCFFEDRSGQQIYKCLVFLCECGSSTLARQTANELQNIVSITVIQYPETLLLDTMDDYMKLCQKLVEHGALEINTLVNKIIVIGFRPQLQQGTEELQTFIRVKCSVSTSIHIAEAVWKLFCDPLKHKWEPVLQCAKQLGVDVCCEVVDKKEHRVVVTGDQNAIEKVSQMINKVIESVYRDSTNLHVIPPGTCKFFHQTNTKLALRGLETEKGVSICLEVKQRAATEKSQPPSQNLVKVCIAHTKEFKRITIYVGDITEFTKADVIVNAANERLDHCGGVAKAIAQKGGPLIQEDSTEYTTIHEPLYPGAVISTVRVGNLPCKCLVHAVGPRWEGGHHNEEALLHKTCLNSLKEVKQYLSIALPAISAGAYDFPIEICAETLIRAVIEFSSSYPHVQLEDVFFVVISHEVAEAFVKSLKRNLQVQYELSDQNSPAAISPPVPHSQAHPARASMKKTRRKKKTSTVTAPDRIKIQKGSLLDVQVYYIAYKVFLYCSVSLGEFVTYTLIKKIKHFVCVHVYVLHS